MLHLEHRLQQYMGVSKTRQCVVEEQLMHRSMCVAEERRMQARERIVAVDYA